MFNKILLPTDGSEFAQHEIERAIKLLADDGEIIILSVASKLEATTVFQRQKHMDEINEAFLEEAHKNVEKMFKKFDEHVNAKKMVVTGVPAETIVRVAEEEGVDLIIIAASGKSGLHRFIIGSVADKVLKTTETDVLLIHN